MYFHFWKHLLSITKCFQAPGPCLIFMTDGDLKINSLLPPSPLQHLLLISTLQFAEKQKKNLQCCQSAAALMHTSPFHIPSIRITFCVYTQNDKKSMESHRDRQTHI